MIDRVKGNGVTNSTGIEPTELHVGKATKMVPTLATTAGKPLLPTTDKPGGNQVAASHRPMQHS